MEQSKKLIITAAIMIVMVCFSVELYAGTDPPNPGVDPTGGGPPVGGGAPIGNGTFILISAGIIYIAYKLYLFRKNMIKIED